jgi:non-specific serine/threonine protein kinase
LPRHQTLRGAIDWSHDLLSERERVLLRRLSVFSGGWSLEAAERVCSDGIQEFEVLDALTQLTFKSLIFIEEHASSVRYRFLETVRQYGVDRLLESGEDQALRKRHRDWYLAFADRAEQELAGSQQTLWFDKVEMEHDNLRAVMEWSLQNGEPEPPLLIAAAVREFWFVRGSMAEGRKWLERALEHENVPPALRAKALRTAGLLAVFGQGDYTAGRAFHQESLQIWRGVGDKQNVAQLLHDLGAVAAGLGEHARARQLYEESIAVRREIGDRVGSAMSLHNLGRVAYREGDYETASSLLEQSLKIWEEASDKQLIGMALTNLGLVACRCGDHARARSFLNRGLAVHRELGDTRKIAFSLEAFGALAASLGEYGQAARIFGAAEKLREALGSPLPPADRPDYDRAVAAARGGLDADLYTATWAEGRAMSAEEAIRETEKLGDTEALKSECE